MPFALKTVSATFLQLLGHVQEIILGNIWFAWNNQLQKIQFTLKMVSATFLGFHLSCGFVGPAGDFPYWETRCAHRGGTENPSSRAYGENKKTALFDGRKKEKSALSES